MAIITVTRTLNQQKGNDVLTSIGFINLNDDLHISSLGGAFEATELEFGDQVLSINSQCVSKGMKVRDAKEILVSSKGEVRIEARKCPQILIFKNMTLHKQEGMPQIFQNAKVPVQKWEKIIQAVTWDLAPKLQDAQRIVLEAFPAFVSCHRGTESTVFAICRIQAISSAAHTNDDTSNNSQR